jgi:hypothetical protein
LTGLIFLQNVFVERGFFDAPTASDLDGGRLATLEKVLDGRQWNAKVFGRFLDR